MSRAGGAMAVAVSRLLVPLIVVVVAGAVFFLGVFPVRTYLDQRGSLAAAEEQLDELVERNEAIRREVEILHDDAEIERLARQEYGLARPGEEIYQVLPPPEDPLRLPDVWPFNHLDRQVGR